MTRAATKKPRMKKGQAELLPEAPVVEATMAVAVEEPPVESAELQPPTTPIETQEADKMEKPAKAEKPGGVSGKEHTAPSSNISKPTAQASHPPARISREPRG